MTTTELFASVCLFVVVVCVCALSEAETMDTSEKKADSPRCLYDIDAIKAASLDDLEWQETARKTLDNGNIMIKGTFTSGEFATINPADVKKGNVNLVHVMLHHPLVFLIPEGMNLAYYVEATEKSGLGTARKDSGIVYIVRWQGGEPHD